MKTWWWITSAVLLCVFLPAGIIMISATILKEISEYLKSNEEPKIERVVKEEYFENTLERFK